MNQKNQHGYKLHFSAPELSVNYFVCKVSWQMLQVTIGPKWKEKCISSRGVLYIHEIL